MNNLSPSNASRRMACPGSHKLEALYPQDKSTYAIEGTAAHWVASELLRRNDWIIPSVTDVGTEITDEMIEGAQLYSGFINSRIHPASGVHIEERMDIHSIHPNCWGTPDCWVLQSPTDIDIYDYKYGRGFVEVYENWQLIEYAAGILDTLGINGILDQHMIIRMHVIQPRSFHPEGQIRTWSVRASELRPYFNILQNGEHAATHPSAKTTVSSECNHCAARHACPALQTASMASVDISTSAVPHNLSATELATELRFLEHASDLIMARISGLSAEALALIQRGERLPHYYATRSKGREKWKITTEQVIALGELYGVELSKPKVVTPKQAITEGLCDKQVRKYSETTYGELKLMALDTRKTDKMFGD